MPKPRVNNSAIDIMLDEVGKSRHALADATGLNQENLAIWARNHTIKNARLKTLYLIAGFFNMDIEEFIDKALKIEDEMNGKKK